MTRRVLSWLCVTFMPLLASLASAQPAADRVTFWTSSSTQSGDDALIWKSGTNRLGINASNPTAVLQAMYDANSALVELGGQTRETLPRTLAVADGSLTLPTSSVNPTLVAERVDSTDDPGSYIPFEFAIKKVSGAGYLYAVHSYVEVDSPTLNDAVAVTGSIVMTPSNTPTGGQTGFGMWSRAERLVTNTRVASAEFDCFNSAASDAPAPFAGDTSNITLGLQLVGAGNAKNTMALEVAANSGAEWQGGIVFDPGSITSSGYAVHLGKLGSAVTPILVSNNAFVKGRNATDTADIQLVGVATDNSVRLGNDDVRAGTSILLSPSGSKVVGIGTVSPAGDAALEVNGGTTRGLRITPRSTTGPPVGGTWSKGTLVVDSAGVLYIRLASSWQKVGGQ